MEMIISLLLLAAGFVLLVKGADWFVDGTSSIAARMGIPQLVIGLHRGHGYQRSRGCQSFFACLHSRQYDVPP